MNNSNTPKLEFEGREVDLIWYGFDIAIIEFENGTQKLIKVEEVGLPKRERRNPTNQRRYVPQL